MTRIDVWGLDKLAPTFSLVTIGDSVMTTGINSTAAIPLITPTIFDAGSGGLSFRAYSPRLTKMSHLMCQLASSVAALNSVLDPRPSDGSGLLNLTFKNTYSGSTLIEQGTLPDLYWCFGVNFLVEPDGGTLQMSVSVSDEKQHVPDWWWRWCFQC